MLPPGDSKKKIENRVKDKTANFVYLAKGRQGDVAKEPTVKQQIVLDTLKQSNGMPIGDLQTICDVTRDVIKRLEKNGYVKIKEEKIDRNPFIHKVIKQDAPHELTLEQQEAYDRINVDEFKEFLLYGITGSR